MLSIVLVAKRLKVNYKNQSYTWYNTYRLRYGEVGLGCGGALQLSGPSSSDLAEVEISSPEYPNAPPAHAECVWRIMAPPGKRVQIDFVDQFYIHPSTG